ncbi:MAG: twin-arginine translocation signal domain-containing protein [Verrucomicrobia bacterium]|nr:twin-arginine translocation signal domain-containing protein [Verrucomicrobiota bacterium]
MNPTFINRRTFLNQASVGIGTAALSSMLAGNAMANPQAWPANLPALKSQAVPVWDRGSFTDWVPKPITFPALSY